MVTLEVHPDRIGPQPDLQIPTLSSVCWFNALGQPGHRIRVQLDRPLGVSENCSTTLAFRPGQDGKALSLELDASECAVLCFHEAGDYAYEVTGAGSPMRGRIAVRGGGQ